MLQNVTSLHCDVVICSSSHAVCPRRKLSLSGCTPGSEESSFTAGSRTICLSKQLSVDEGICICDTMVLALCNLSLNAMIGQW